MPTTSGNELFAAEPRDAVDAEALRLAQRGDVDARALARLAKEARGEPRTLARLVVAEAWSKRAPSPEPDAREATLRLATAYVHASRGALDANDAAFLEAALLRDPRFLDRAAARGLPLSRDEVETVRAALGASPARALGVLRARLASAGVPERSLDRLQREASEGKPPLVALADSLHALLELELRLMGFDTNALRTDAGREEARAVRGLVASARAGALRDTERAFLRGKLRDDPDYLKRLLTRGALLDARWHPLANAEEVALLEAALAGGP